MTKKEVLSLYRRILRVARTWKAPSSRAEDTFEERNYIASQCRELFRQNSKLIDDREISRCLEEANSRLEIALHYGNPYPRPVNLPPMGLASQGKTNMKAQQRARKQSKPVYLHSHKELE